MNAHSKVWSLRSKLWYAHSKFINEESTVSLRLMYHFVGPYPRLQSLQSICQFSYSESYPILDMVFAAILLGWTDCKRNYALVKNIVA